MADGKTPFNPLKEYDRIVGEQCRENRTWRRIAIFSMSAFFISLAIVFYALNLPKTVPVVITVSDWGEAKYIGDVSRLSYQKIQVPEVAIQYQLRKFLTNLNTIVADPEVVRNNIKDCYSTLTPTSADKLTRLLKENNPLKDFGSVRKQIVIESILKLSNTTYQVDYIETISRPDGQIKERVRYRSVLTTALLEPAEGDKINNPLGIYITDFDSTAVGVIQ